MGALASHVLMKLLPTFNLENPSLEQQPFIHHLRSEFSQPSLDLKKTLFAGTKDPRAAMANPKPKLPDLEERVETLTTDTIKKAGHIISNDGEHKQSKFNASSSATGNTSSDCFPTRAVASDRINHYGVCKSPAKYCCTACSNVLLLAGSDLKRTSYCSPTCQKVDWPRRKLLCKTFRSLLDRLSLSRAAEFLQLAFYADREAAFDLSIKSLEVKNKVATFYEGDYGDTFILPGFPHELVKGREPWVKSMMLTMLACTDLFVQIEDVVHSLIER